jgi:trimeric autotransporter adhesin
MTTKGFILMGVALPIGCAAQVTYPGGTYTQDFNSLDSGVIYRNYTTMPTGWVVSKGSYVWTTVTNGYSNNYGTYCFSSSPNDPDKSIGLVIGSTGQAYLGAWFRNETSRTLTAFSLSYSVKQWAKGAVTSDDQAIPFGYSLDATNLTSGTFVNVAALDMHSIHDGNGVFSALNGNAVSNRQIVAGTVSGISWLPGQELWIRWSGVSYPFTWSHALAVDDLSFRAVPALQVSSGGLAHLRVSWSTNYAGYTLQSALTPKATGWTTVTNEPVISNGEFGVEIETTAVRRFFRLKMQ